MRTLRDDVPPLHYEWHEHVRMLCVVVLQADAEEERLAFADKSVHV
jgi:hypothetical protein